MRATARATCPRASRAGWRPRSATTPRTSPTRSVPTSASSTSTPAPAVVKVRRFIAVDDCGTRINPMIIEGQVHGGLTDGVGMALMEMIAFDEDGNCLGGSLMDYLIPTALEVPHWETGHTVTPSPHHPIGAKGVGESATVGSPPAVVNAVVDALKPFGIRHADMPLTPSRVWDAMQGRPDAADLTEDRADDHDRCRHADRRADRATGVPFVQATVVRAQEPSSAHAGRPGDRAGRRLHRGLRRRPLRRRVGAHGGARRPRLGREHAAAGAARRRRRVPGVARVRASWSTRACPAERWRSTSSRCCPRPLLHLVGTSPMADAVADARAAARASWSTARPRRRARRARPPWSSPATGATRPGRSGRRSTPGSASSAWSAAAPAGESLLAELDLTAADGRAGPRARRARHRRAHRAGGGACRSWPRSCAASGSRG